MNGENLRMGLAPIEMGEWLQVDSDWQRYHQHKVQLGNSSLDRVFAQQAGSQPAVEELCGLVRDHLLCDHADQFEALDSAGLVHTPSATPLPAAQGDRALWTLSTWLQEDLLVLQRCEGEYCLTAGSVCLPSRWSLREKLGQPMHAIHEPVPELNARLGDRIDRFFHHLRVERPVERFNWSLQTDAALADFPAPSTPVEHLHYRVERQTLRRLPKTDAIAFTVRIYVVPIESIAAIPGALNHLRNDIAAMPEAFGDYKRMPLFRAALAEFTDSSEKGA